MLTAAKIYRLAATGLCFALFYTGGLCLSVCWFHLLQLCVRDAGRRQQLARRSIRQSFRLFIFLLCSLRLIRLELRGMEQVCADRGCIIVANHPSLIDYVIIASLTDNLNCVVKADLLHNFFLKGVIKSARYAANDDPQLVLEATQQSLGRGENLLIFPEGTRTDRSRPLKLHRGAAVLAVKLRSPLRPVTISCSEEFLSRQRGWSAVPDHTPHYILTAHPLIGADEVQDADAAPGEEVPDSIAARRLTRRLTALFAAV